MKPVGIQSYIVMMWNNHQGMQYSDCMGWNMRESNYI